MVIETGQLYWMHTVSNLLLFILVLISIYYVMLSLPLRPKRWRWLKLSVDTSRKNVPLIVQRLLLIPQKPEYEEERRQLLIRCGIQLNPSFYEASRRICGMALLGVGILGYFALKYPLLTLSVEPVYIMAGSAAGLICIVFDSKLLEQLKQQRSDRIVKEIYTLSNQLMYYSGSKMNVHTKLTRCLPYTRTIRSALQLMLNEWYQDAETALRRFKHRLGTDEAHSFAETMNSLRLNENERYYELLRQRIQDYKDKIELAKESRKETVSYLLFVLAGLPILNTFRVFLYPWIIEGQKLFDTMN